MDESQPPPLPPPVMQYATPIAYEQAANVAAWRSGDVLIVTNRIGLPMRCVKCNMEVTDGWRWRKTLYWHHPALALMIIFPGLLIYAIVALIVRQKATVEASLCEAHRARRRTRIMLTTFAAIGSFVALFGGIIIGASSRGQEHWVFIGILMFVVLLIVSLIFGAKARVLSPTKIDAQFAWLKGAGPDFLSNFPSAG